MAHLPQPLAFLLLRVLVTQRRSVITRVIHFYADVFTQRAVFAKNFRHKNSCERTHSKCPDNVKQQQQQQQQQKTHYLLAEHLAPFSELIYIVLVDGKKFV